MDSSPRSLAVYAAAVVLFLVVIAIWTVFSLIPRARRAAAHPSRPDGHFNWAQAEMHQIAEARNPVAAPQTDAKLSAALMRVDLEVEVGRIISELSDEPRSPSRTPIVEAVSRSVGLIRSYGAMQRRLAEARSTEPTESRPAQGFRYDQLRRAMEVDDRRALPRNNRALLTSRGH